MSKRKPFTSQTLWSHVVLDVSLAEYDLNVPVQDEDTERGQRIRAISDRIRERKPVKITAMEHLSLPEIEAALRLLPDDISDEELDEFLDIYSEIAKEALLQYRPTCFLLPILQATFELLEMEKMQTEEAYRYNLDHFNFKFSSETAREALFKLRKKR